MRVKGSIIGSAKLAKAIEKTRDGYEEAAKLQLKLAALQIHGEAKKSIRQTSEGESEIRYKPKRTVRVSKPGDPPNNDNSTLIKNIGWNLDEENLSAEVGTGLKYGKWLEFGTKKKLKARPWLGPAIEKAKPMMQQIFRSMKPKRKTG